MIKHPNCEECIYSRGGCKFKKCRKWLAWFKQEWRTIRRAAELIKEQEGEKKHE